MTLDLNSLLVQLRVQLLRVVVGLQLDEPEQGLHRLRGDCAHVKGPARALILDLERQQLLVLLLLPLDLLERSLLTRQPLPRPRSLSVHDAALG